MKSWNPNRAPTERKVMRRYFVALCLSVAGLGSAPAVAQYAWTNLEPAGGATILEVIGRSDGWFDLKLVESFPETQNCLGTSDPALGSYLGSSRLLRIYPVDSTNFGTPKQLQMTVLTAFMTGKKLAQLVFTRPDTSGGTCYLKLVRIAQ